jgi:hypothetical protein
VHARKLKNKIPLKVELNSPKYSKSTTERKAVIKIPPEYKQPLTNWFL